LEFKWDKKAETVEIPQGIAAETEGVVLTNQIQVEVQVLLLSRLRLGLNVTTLDFNDENAMVPRTVQLTGSAKEAVVTEVKRPANSRFKYEFSEDKRSLAITAVMDHRSPKRHVMENWTLLTSDEQIPQLTLSLNLHVKHDFTVTPDSIELNGKLPLKGCLLVKPLNPRKAISVSQAVWENGEGKVEIRKLPRGLTRIDYSLEKITDEKKNIVLRMNTDSKLQEEVVVVVGQR
jgi:hypothetical protein